VRPTRPLVVAGAVLALLVAIGALAALTRDPKRTFVLPKCARPAHAIQPPRPFPRSLPLPEGTMFSTVSRISKVLAVGGRAPLELIPAAQFFVRELPRKGFTLGAAEEEQGFESEQTFSGNGTLGRVRVRVLPACRGAVHLLVSVTRALPGTGLNPTTTPGKLPACAQAGPGVVSGLPASFPLPAGTVVRSSRRQAIRARSFDFVSAFSPGTVDSAARFLLHDLPKAGYRITAADRETNEAEAAFAGPGIQGRIRFHTFLGCSGALTLDLATTNR
jgi:hypothetical protein